MAKVNMSWCKTEIKGVKCTEIDWCVEIEDVYDTDEMTGEEIDAAIEEIEADLPTEKYYPLPQTTNDLEVVKEFVNGLADKLSDDYGWLINAFNYKLIGVDDKEYEFWHRN